MLHLPTPWRAGLLQAALVIVLFAILGLLLDEDFFESWGWLVGPVAWMGCAATVARVIGLPLPATLTGAALAGLLSVPFILIHLHPVGMLASFVAFGLWCGRVRTDPDLPAETI